jgi:hypothetical protein
MNIHNSCYKFEEYIYKRGILDETVDATYIIHLENNGRLEDIHVELNKIKPTKKVYVVFNKGYKNCSKHDYIDTSAKDLFDANVQIFNHANKMNYNNILVLEDDFVFSEKIKEQSHINNVNNFLKKNNNKPYIYLLGCIPNLLVPYDYYNYRAVGAGGTHSVIYNLKMRNIILQEDPTKIKNHDDYFIIYYFHYKYTYYIPLIYQLFAETENQNEWGAQLNDNFKFLKIFPYVVLYMHKLLKTNEHPEPGFSIFYFLSKLLFFIVLFIIIYIFYKLFFTLMPFLIKRSSFKGRK